MPWRGLRGETREPFADFGAQLSALRPSLVALGISEELLRRMKVETERTRGLDLARSISISPSAIFRMRGRK